MIKVEKVKKKEGMMREKSWKGTEKVGIDGREEVSCRRRKKN